MHEVNRQALERADKRRQIRLCAMMDEKDKNITEESFRCPFA
jgi:hypothetical protein